MTESTTTRSKSYTSRFEYVENAPAARTGSSSEDNQMSGHVAPPKSSNFFAEFGMDSGYHKKSTSSSSKVQVAVVLHTIVVNHEYVNFIMPSWSPGVLVLSKYICIVRIQGAVSSTIPVNLISLMKYLEIDTDTHNYF